MSLRSGLSFAHFVALRYSFSRKRNRFTGIIATVSMLGMVLGVASLIVVLSVMNGFSGELRGRILSLVPHGYIESTGGGLEDWPALLAQLETRPGVLAAAPYISDKAIIGAGRSLRGAVVTAVAPELEQNVSNLGQSIVLGNLDSLAQEGKFNIVLGSSLARLLGVGLGDSVEVTVPRLTVTPLGVFPRSKRFTVTGLFQVGAQPCLLYTSPSPRDS